MVDDTKEDGVSVTTTEHPETPDAPPAPENVNESSLEEVEIEVAMPVGHSSDCAVNNGPAETPGPCDCGLQEYLDAELEKAREQAKDIPAPVAAAPVHEGANQPDNPTPGQRWKDTHTGKTFEWSLFGDDIWGWSPIN